MSGTHIEPFSQMGRDLYAHITCQCGERNMLIGYSDDNFFDNVNAVPRVHVCPECGRWLAHHWTRDGVIVPDEGFVAGASQ